MRPRPNPRIHPYLLVCLLACGSITPSDQVGKTTEDGGTLTTVTGTSGTIPCDPGDAHEDEAGTGNTCGVDAVNLGDLADDGATITFTGDLNSVDDRDWFWVHAVDLEDDLQRGWEDFRFEAALTAGEGTFEIRVLRGGCLDIDNECDGVGYDSYSWFIEDTEPDEQGDIPPVLQACGGPPFDECMDWSGDFYIEVMRIDGGNDCTPYEVVVSNGVWPIPQ